LTRIIRKFNGIKLCSVLKWTASSTRAQNIIKEKVERFTIKYVNEMNSQIGGKHYNLDLEIKTIIVSISISFADYTDGFGLKIDYLLDLNVKDEEFIKESTKKISELETSLNSKFQSKLLIDVDWDFVMEKSFKEKDETTRKNMILGMHSIIQKGITSSEPLTKLLESQRALDSFLDKVKVIKLVYVQSLDKNEGHFLINHEGSTLYVKVNISYFNYTTGWFAKTEKALDLNLKDEIMMKTAEKNNLDLEKSLKPLVETIIDIDWDSLVSESSFKDKDENSRKNLINSTTNIIKKGLNDSKNGLITYLKLSQRFQQFFNHFIKKILIVFQKSIVSNGGNPHHSCERQGSTMIVKVNQNFADLTDGWGEKMDIELDINVKDEIVMKEVTKKIGDYEKDLEKSVGKKIFLEVDWSSIIENSNFKKKDESSRKNMMNAIANIFKKGIVDKNCFKELQKVDSLKTAIVSNVGQIIVKSSPSIDPKVGSNNYEIQFVNGCLLVSVKAELYENTDNFFDKIKYLSTQIEQYQGEQPKLLGTHHYLLLPTFDQVIESQKHLTHFYFKPHGGKSDEIVLDQTPLIQSKHKYLEEVVAIKGESKGVDLSKSVMFLLPDEKKETIKSIEPKIVEVKPQEKPIPKVTEVKPVVVQLEPVAKIPEEKKGHPNQEVPIKTPILSSPLEEAKKKSDSLCQSYFDEMKYNLKLSSISIDWSFIESKEFQQLDSKKQISVIEKISNLMGSIKGCFVKIWNDPVDLEEFSSKIENIIFKKDSTDQIKTKRSSSYYDMMLEAKTLVFIENMSNTNSSYGQFNEAIDLILDTSVKKAKNVVLLRAVQFKNEISKHIDKDIELTFDWSFIESENFIKLDQKKVEAILQLEKKHSSSISSFVRSLSSDLIDKESLQGLTGISITFDPLSENTKSTFSLELKSSVLCVIINLNKYSDSLNANQFYEYFEVIFQNTLAKIKKDVEKKITIYEEYIEKSLSFPIKISVDWSFASHEDFVNMEPKKKIEIANKIKDPFLHNIHRYIAGLGVDEVEKKFATNIKSIIFTFDPTNEIKEAFKVQLENGVFSIAANLNKYGAGISNIPAIVDPIFQLRVPKGIRDTNLKIVQYESKLYESFTKIQIEVDWEFTKHEYFTSLPLEKHSEAIKKISENHLYYIVQGLLGFAPDPVCQESIKRRIQKINFTYDPKNEVNNVFDISLKNGVLFVVMNMNKYTDAISSFKERMDPILNLRVDMGIRDSIEKLANLQSKMETIFPNKILLSVDWDFTNSEEFLNRDIKDYTLIIKKIWEKLGFYSIQKLTGFYIEKKFDEKIFSDYVDEITLTYDAKNQISQVCHSMYEEKNTNFCARLINRKLTFAVNLKNYSDCADSWHTRIQPILESINAMNSFDQAKNLQSNLSISVDWESFINSTEFTSKDQETRRNIVDSFHKRKLETIQKVLTTFNQTEIGKTGFTKHVENIYMSIDVHSSSDETIVTYFDKQININYPLNAKSITADNLFLEISKLIGVLVPYHVDLTSKRIKTVHSMFMDNIDSKFEIETDWTFTESPTFNNLSPLEMRKIINQSTETLFTFLDSLSDVYFGVRKLQIQPKPKEEYETIYEKDQTINHNVTCDRCHERNFVGRRFKCQMCNDFDLCQKCYENMDHVKDHTFHMFGNKPIKRKIPSDPEFRDSYKRDESKNFPGFTFLSKNLKKVVITVDPEENQPSIGDLQFNKGELKLTLNKEQTMKPFEAFWIERLQWVFDLIVPIAEYDAKETISTLESSFTFTKIKIDVDSSFSKHKKFLEKSHDAQFNLIRLVYLELTNKVVSSLYKVAIHPIGQSIVKSNITNVSFSIDADNSQPKEGTITHSGKTLKTVVNIDDLSKAIEANYWKSRIELIFNLVVNIALYDNLENVSRIENEMTTLLGKKLNLVIDTSFTNFNEFKSKSSQEQSDMVISLCTTIANLCVGKEIMDICKFKSGQSTMSKLNQIIINTDHLNKQSNEPSFIWKYSKGHLLEDSRFVGNHQ
jgi:hypothetical protein